MNGLRTRLRADWQELAQLLADIDGKFIPYVNSFKRMPVPESIPESMHPWYRAKGFYLEKDIKDFTLIKSSALAQEIINGYTELIPLFRYFDSIVPEEDMV